MEINKDPNRSNIELHSAQGPSAPLLTLEHKLESLDAKQVAVFSDMSGTLLLQREDGFPEQTKASLISFLDQGGTLVIVTGDSSPIAFKEFFDRLDYKGTAPIYLIAGGGFEIFKWGGHQAELLFRGRELSKQEKEILCDALVDTIKSCIAPQFAISSQVKSLLLDGPGARVDVSAEIPAMSEPLLIEISCNKATLYFPNKPEASGQHAVALDNLCSMPSVVELAKSGVHVIRGANFVDIITAVKEEGIAHFMSMPQVGALGIGKKSIVAMGDSANDLGLLTFPFQTTADVYRIFLGKDDSPFRAQLAAVGLGALHHLPSTYIEGGGQIINSLAAQSR